VAFQAASWACRVPGAGLPGQIPGLPPSGTAILAAVEGWFDVFAFGPMALAVLGHHVSEPQVRGFTSFWGKAGRSGVWPLDPEGFEARASRRLVAKLRGMMGEPFAAVKLPPGTDRGSLDRDLCRAHVAEQAARQGVKVDHERLS
jgi:hypothetical protein